MAKIKKDKLREHRIINEIIVDAYDPEERMMGWQAYLDDSLTFPFKARCIKEILISPLDLFNNSVSCLTSLAKCTAFCSF
jgi:hypothetical protein